MQIIIDATISQIKPHSGVGQYTKNLITELVKYEDIQFVVVAFEDDSDFFAQLSKLGNVELFRIRRATKLLEDLFPYNSILKPYIKQLLQHYSGSIFFSPYVLNGFPNEFKTFVTVHDFAMPQFDQYSNRGGLINWYRKMQYWYFMDRTVDAQGVITISDSTMREYLKRFPNFDKSKISKISLGIELDEKEIDVARYLPSDWKEKGYFIYLGGGIQKNKNSIGVINAYADFAKRFDDEKKVPYLVIAGKIFEGEKFPEMMKIRDRIDQMHLDEKVYFTGFFPDEAKYSLLKNSIAFIHLSLCEGFGIAVAEAMRAGAPVIAHNGSSYPEVVGDTGYLVNGNDPVECGSTMYGIYMHPEVARQKAIMAKARSQIFTWENTAKQVLMILKGE